ncbi:hypothetical protein H8B09_19400 [Paenibacillus sp. PR3]|uniref:Uncharacterized protein n=1 Tax=Paenibacillus terricola TaxID=2763503 RepID=A0ABR8N0A0_9BACL|nr:hypothetical protein [Paenibacillus terricola]MBD3920941.1 hypothetical protein [Paenibacillus terricola]
MDGFDKRTFITRNNPLSVKSLISFLEVEVKVEYIEEIKDFLHLSKVSDEKELTDHFIVKLSGQEVLIYNETVERFAQNPEVYRFTIDIEQLINLMDQTISLGVAIIKSNLSNY